MEKPKVMFQLVKDGLLCPPKTTFYKLKHGHSQSKNCSNYNHPIKSLFLITIFMSEMTIFCVFLHYGNIDSANNLIYIFASN